MCEGMKGSAQKKGKKEKKTERKLKGKKKENFPKS